MTDPTLNELAQQLADLKTASGDLTTAANIVWTLVCGFLVMFMQAGFALVETGLCRRKNAAHVMAMNFLVYIVGIIGFWTVGFALLMGWFCQLYESGAERARVTVALLAQAAGIEIMQGFTTWRSAEFGDWVAGAVGIGLGWLASSPRTPNVLRWLVPRPG